MSLHYFYLYLTLYPEAGWESDKTGTGLNSAVEAGNAIKPEGERLRSTSALYARCRAPNAAPLTWASGAAGRWMWNDFIGRRHQGLTNRRVVSAMAPDSKMRQHRIKNKTHFAYHLRYTTNGAKWDKMARIH